MMSLSDARSQYEMRERRDERCEIEGEIEMWGTYAYTIIELPIASGLMTSLI